MASAHVKPLIGGGGGRRRGGRGFHTLFLILVYSAMVAECRELTVGDQMGWTNYDKRSFQVPDYVQWASRQQVRVGDQLVFKYSRGLHNVNLLLNKAAYESCDFSHAKVLDTGSSGGYVWKATKEGVYYFGCNKRVEAEGNHCGSGQKFSIVVRPLLTPTLQSTSTLTTLPSLSSSKSTTLSSSNEGFQLALSPSSVGIATVPSVTVPTKSSSSPMSSSAPSMPPHMESGAGPSEQSILKPSLIILPSIMSFLVGML